MNKTIRNKVDYINNNKNQKFDGVFLGSSRVEYHVNTELIDSITATNNLNLGISGQNLNETFLVLKLLVSNNIKAKKYFIQIDEKGLSNKKQKSFIGASYFMPYIKNNHVNDHLKKYDPDYHKDYYIPFYRYLKYGYKIGYRELALKLIEKKRAQKFYIGLNKTIEEENVSYILNNTYDSSLLKEIMFFSDTHNLNIIFFTSPYYNPKKIERFNTFCKQNNIISYIDSITSKEKFKDSEHLNYKGANEFSYKIIRDFY